MLEASALSFKDLLDFLPDVVERQEASFNQFIDMCVYITDWPDHWAVFKDNGVPVFIVGIYDTGNLHFDSFTFFSKKFEPKHLRFVIKFVKNYMRMLSYESIFHAVEDGDIAMQKFITLLGFKRAGIQDGKIIFRKVKLWV